MANHMAEVANMLGVELGEEFYIREDNSIKCRIYNDGLYVDPVSDNICTLTHSGEMLYSLLKGDVAIKRKPWKPKRQDMFWYVAKDGNSYCELWEDTTFNFMLYKAKNCYRSKREAESNRDKWVKFYASDKVLEV